MSKPETYLCGDNENLVCARCGAKELIGFPISVDDFVKKTRRFNKAHTHRELSQAGGLPLSYIKRMMGMAE